MQWQKRRLQGVKKCYINRLAPQSVEDPLYIVPKAASEHNWNGLDSRGVFLIQVPGVWSKQAVVAMVMSVAAGACRSQVCASVPTALPARSFIGW